MLRPKAGEQKSNRRTDPPLKAREIKFESKPGEVTQRFNAKFLAEIDLEKTMMLKEIRKAESRIKNTIGIRLAPVFPNSARPQVRHAYIVAKNPIKRDDSFSLGATNDRNSLLDDYRTNFKYSKSLDKRKESALVRKNTTPLNTREVEEVQDSREPLLFTAPFEYYSEHRRDSNCSFDRQSTNLIHDINPKGRNSSFNREGTEEGKFHSKNEISNKIDRDLHSRKDSVALFLGSLAKVCCRSILFRRPRCREKTADDSKDALPP